MGFSLVELMIAIIILGFGMLTIGMVLPVAWDASRRTSALTRADGATKVSREIILRKARVDGRRDLLGATGAGLAFDPLNGPDEAPDTGDSHSYFFLGDYDTLDLVDDDGDGTPDPEGTGSGSRVIPRVHALNMENWAFDRNSRFLPDAAIDLAVPEGPILIEYYPPTLPDRWVGSPSTLGLDSDPAMELVGAPVIRLRERTLPAMPESLTPADPQWIDVLSSRQYFWSVLYRFDRVPTSPDEPRVLTLYTVTLRRTSDSNRYARQSHLRGLIGPNPPLALGSVDDVFLPVAWRVPMILIDSPAGQPAQAFVGVTPTTTLSTYLPPQISNSTLVAEVDNSKVRVAEMFSEGTYFVDDVNGNIYRVLAREYIDSASTIARLTVDQEVTPEELDYDPVDASPPWQVDEPEYHRMVWVYPPPVALEAREDEAPVRFVGASPVVSIEAEPVQIFP